MLFVRADKVGFWDGGVGNFSCGKQKQMNGCSKETLGCSHVCKFSSGSLYFSCFSLKPYFVTSSLFAFCNGMGVSSVAVIFSEPESERLWRERGKIHVVTSQKCWRPSYPSKNCSSQFLLTAIRLKIPTLKKNGLEYLQPVLQLMRVAEPKHHWKSSYQSRSLAPFDGGNTMP